VEGGAGQLSITAIRHGKVNMRWPHRCNAEEFDRVCRQYDKADIMPIHTEKKENVTGKVYISTQSRSDTVKRAKEVIRQIEKEEECVVVTHGFFMKTFLGQLKKAGYVLEGDRAFGFHNLQVVRAAGDGMERKETTR